MSSSSAVLAFAAADVDPVDVVPPRPAFIRAEIIQKIWNMDDILFGEKMMKSIEI